MKKILIAEDDDAIAMIEKDYLTLYGFSVEIANDGRKALTRALQGDFDLILLDVMLPSLDGFAICEELRKHLDVPIIFVTAKTGDLDKIRGLGLGGDDYVEKPFLALGFGGSGQVPPRRIRAAQARGRRAEEARRG
jgi:DNA-binding response OmpR family regulator